MQVRSSESVKNLIGQGNAVVKMIESNEGDDTHWIFLLKQLAHPKTYRPVPFELATFF